MAVARPSDVAMAQLSVAAVIAAATVAVLGHAKEEDLSLILGCAAIILGGIYIVEAALGKKSEGCVQGRAAPSNATVAATETVPTAVVPQQPISQEPPAPVPPAQPVVPSRPEPVARAQPTSAWRGGCLLTIFSAFGRRRREQRERRERGHVAGGGAPQRISESHRYAAARQSQALSSPTSGGQPPQQKPATSSSSTPPKGPSKIEALCDLGQVLNAERLLGTVEANDPFAKQIPGLRRAASATRQFVEDLGRGEGWKRQDLPGGYLLYNYDKGGGNVEFMARLAMDVQPLHLWALFREFDLSPAFVKNNEHSHPIWTFNGSRELYHFKAKPLVRHITAGTQAFQDRNFVDALDETDGFLLCLGFATPLDATSYEGLVDMPPPSRGYKRITVEARDLIIPVHREGGGLESILTVHRNLKTPFKVPEWAVSWVVGSAVQAQMNSLKGALAAWSGSGHEERVLHGPRAAYYAGLRSRLEACARARAAQQ